MELFLKACAVFVIEYLPPLIILHLILRWISNLIWSSQMIKVLGKKGIFIKGDFNTDGNTIKEIIGENNEHSDEK